MPLDGKKLIAGRNVLPFPQRGAGAAARSAAPMTPDEEAFARAVAAAPVSDLFGDFDPAENDALSAGLPSSGGDWFDQLSPDEKFIELLDMAKAMKAVHQHGRDSAPEGRLNSVTATLALRNAAAEAGFGHGTAENDRLFGLWSAERQAHLPASLGGYDEARLRAVWDSAYRQDGALGVGSLIREARHGGYKTPTEKQGKLVLKGGSASYKLDDLVFLEPERKYLVLTTGRKLLPEVVAKRCEPFRYIDADGKEQRVPADIWLAMHKAVRSETWAPSHPRVIAGLTATEKGGFVEDEGALTYNSFREPQCDGGDPTARFVTDWEALGSHLFGAAEWVELRTRLAFLVQKPREKIGHATVIVGEPRLGKDALLQPVVMFYKQVGETVEVSPEEVMGSFNDFLMSKLVRINEASDTGDFDKFKFAQRTKTMFARTPDTLRVNRKHQQPIVVENRANFIMTTNSLSSLSLSENTGRHFIAMTKVEYGWQKRKGWDDWAREEMGEPHGFFAYYFKALDAGGWRDVVAHLKTIDISGFNPAAEPVETLGYGVMRTRGQGDLHQFVEGLIERWGRPATLTSQDITESPDYKHALFMGELSRPKNGHLPNVLAELGYKPQHSRATRDGRFKNAATGKWFVLHVRKGAVYSEIRPETALRVNGPTVNIHG
jgi:hypothetical protein